MSFPDRPQQVPIAVVGAGALLPGSSDVAGFWRTVVDGRDLITDVPPTHWLLADHYDPDPKAPDRTYARRGGFLSPVDFPCLEYGVPPSIVEATDTSQLLALLVAEQVLTDATGGDLETLDRDRVSVLLGTGTLELMQTMSNRLQRPVWLKALREHGVPEPDAQAICERIADHYVPWQEATFPGALSNVVSGRIANRFDLHGTNHTTDAACAGSLAAISTAVNELALGVSDMAIAGGVDTLNDPLMFTFFSKTPALSPSGDCRPFSAAADGTILGEGVVMFALKRLADAERDGDHVHAVLRGVGTASDGRATAIYAPLPEGQAIAIRRAYASAGYGPDTVELVEAHGTGTKAGDLAEYTGLRATFTESGRTGAPWCALGSVKSQVGHTKSAAGAAGMLKAILALRHKVLPPTIKVDRPNPELDLDGPLYLNTAARPWVRDPAHPRRASVSSFGFGGSNFHMTLEEYVPAPDSQARPSPRLRTVPTELVPFSADSPDALLAEARTAAEAGALPAVAYRAQQAFRSDRPYRLAVVAQDTADLAAKIAQAAALVGNDPEAPFSTPAGVHYAAGPAAPGKIAFLFSGQGSQYVGMGADVAMHLPQAQAVWDRAAALPVGDRPLHRVVFPLPVFDDGARAAQRALLTRTEWAQPALAVQSMALLEVLESAGVRPDAVAGHSFGELTALHAAGVVDADALVRMARRRGELMRDAAATPGGMLAVAGTLAEVEAALGPNPVGVWVANHNSPRQIVLSGTHEALDAAERQLARAGLTAKRLDTATGFHSPLVAPASEPFLDFLNGIPFGRAEVPVYGNTAAAPYPADPDAMRRTLAEHLAMPVRFADEIEAMFAAGVRTFVEVGAGAVLTGLVGDVLGARAHRALSVDVRGRPGMTSLHAALAVLVVQGTDVDLTALWDGYDRPAVETETTGRRPQMTIPIDGGNHGRPYPPPGGAADLPPPNPVPAVPAPTARSAPEPAVPVAPLAAEPAPVPAAHQSQWLTGLLEDQRRTADVHARFQQQAAEAHATYQRLMADSHLAFLQALEGTYGAPAAAPAHVHEVASGSRDAYGFAGAASTLGGGDHVRGSRSDAEGERHEARTGDHLLPHHRSVPRPPVMSPPPAPPAAAPVPAPVPAGADLEGALLSVVADKTGYPVDMLASDMDLEADLGVDSIKRVQILSALREEVPDLPAVDAAELGRLRTIGEIVGRFADDPGPGVVATAAAAGSPAAAPEGGLRRHAVGAVAIPAPGLEMAGLGDGPLAVTDDGTGVAAHVAARLTARGVAAAVVTEVPSDAHGVVFLGGLRSIRTPEEALAVHHEAFRAAKAVAGRCTRHGGVFVTVQDTGGDFGFGGRAGVRAWSGGLAALARTAGREWQAASVKAIDCERADRDPDAVADAIVRELLTGGDTVDVGLRADGARLTVCEDDVTDERYAVVDGVGPDSVIVATGGARGVTAAALVELARARQPRIALLGRSPLDGEPAELAAVTDEKALRAAVAALIRHADGGRAPVPATVAAAVSRILAVREIRANVAAMEAAGSKVRYLAADIRDPAAVAAAMAEVRREWGPITGVVHGAGVLADKNITDKTDDQFDGVFGTKAAGLAVLLAATRDDPIDTLCLFSSVAARFGNPGQCDYAMANEVLNQVACAERAARPGCRVSAIAWGPWRGGMVDPALEEHFRAQGVGLIPVADGARAFVEVLMAPGPDTQVVVAGAAVTDVFGSGSRERVSAGVRVTGESYPYLADHAIGGTPVLPMAMALEWFTAAVGSWHPAGAQVALRNVDVLRKVALDGAGRRLVVEGRRCGAAQDPIALRLLGDDGTPYYSAETGEAGTPRNWAVPAGLVRSDGAGVYDGQLLFHGPRFQVLRAVEVGQAGAVAALAGLFEMGWGVDRPWWTDAAITDGGLQLALLWAARALGAATLPMSVAECRVHRVGPATGRVRCVLRAGDLRGDWTTCDIGFLDEDGGVRAELFGVSLVKRPS